MFTRSIMAFYVLWGEKYSLEQPIRAEQPATAGLSAQTRTIRFKKLSLQGFKSFPDPTQLSFEDSICAIVGPNGCGKSNILDALRWVLGEQGPSQLRARSMSDVIFNGSAKRKPVGMAEVTLTIDCPAGLVSLPYEEIAVTRRLYRSGESEYLINRSPCRLKDITDLFLDTGVGRGAYSLIEQGRVDVLVTARPEERRGFIEQIAGIEKFKVRKKEALSRLASTENNLARVKDVISEVHSRRASLARQARKAKKYRTLKAELQDVQKALSTARYAKIQKELRQLDTQTKHLENVMTRTATHIALQSAAHQESYKLVDAAQEKLRKTAESFDQVENRIDYLENRIKDFDDRRLELEKEIETEQANANSQERRCIDLNNQAKRLDQELETLTEQAGTISEEMETLETQRQQMNAHIRLLREQLADARARRLKQITRCSDLRNRIQGGEDKLRYLAQRQSELALEKESLATTQGDLSRRLADLGEKISRMESVQSALLGRQQTATADKALATQAFKEADERLRVLEKERLSLQSRLESLLEIDAAGEGFDSGVKRVLKRFPRTDSAKPDISSVIGTLADIYDTPDEYEEAVTAALYSRLQDIVVSGSANFDAICRFLIETQPGRVTVRHVSKNGGDQKRAHHAPPGLRALVDCISTADEFKPMFDELLAATFLAPDEETAAAAAAAQPETTIVTPDGLRWGPGNRRTFGRPIDNRPVFRRRQKEINELKTKVADAVVQEQAALQVYQDCDRHLKDVVMAWDSIQEQISGAVQQLAVAEGELAHRRLALDETAGRYAAVTKEKEGLIEEMGAIGHQLETLRQALGEMEAQTNISDDLNKLEATLEESDKESIILRDILTEKRIQARSAADRTVFVQREQARLRNETDRLMEIAEQYRHQASVKRQLVVTETTRARELADELEALIVDAPVRKNRLETLKSQLEQANQAKQGAAVHLAELEQSDRALERDLAEVRVKQASLETARDALSEDLTWNPAEEAENLESIPDETEMNDWKQRIELLQQNILLFSDVNLGAEHEHREVTERSRFLDEQLQDLEHAVHSLRTTIQQIDRTSKTRFIEAFNVVTEHFGTIFQKLFGGGEARLELTNPNDLLDSGVDIVCKPPGKRARTIDLLSGGEKALSALALLLSGFKYRPSPLLFLDEVDAPLDEHNVTRFTQFLKSLAETTQIVMITHNALTMEAAETLYGVTMEEPGISKLVGAKLTRPVRT